MGYGGYRGIWGVGAMILDKSGGGSYKGVGDENCRNVTNVPFII